MYEANDSSVDGLVNFDKLRMMSREISKVAALQSVPFDECGMVGGKAEKKV